MNRRREWIPRVVVLSGLTWLLSSCAFTETTTETVANTSEATVEFTSSTSPRDSTSAAEQKVYAFTTVNFERIREDMARGGGEYLASLASLMGIPEAGQPAFFALTKERFPGLLSSDELTPRELVARLEQMKGMQRDRAS
ncbi:MAG: DUF3015 family protein [Gammaproteobacteria bacterium]